MIEGALDIDTTRIRIPPNRFRTIKKEVEEIVKSFKEHGQLQPIIVKPIGDGYFELVDGLHRLTAGRNLEWDTIACVTTDELDPLKLREIELEANIRRIDMTWQERERATAQLHELKMEHDPNWTQRQTAIVAKRSQTRVAEALRLTKMIEIFPELAEAKTQKQALSWMKQKAKTMVRAHEVRTKTIDYAAIEEKIVHGDSVEVIKEVPDESFHLVLTDPPFGINYDNRKAGTEQAVSAYEDSEGSYIRLLGMADDLYRVVKKDGWLIWFLGPSWYERAKEAFREAGFAVDEMPIVWDRSDGKSYTTRPDRFFTRAYDIALHCRKGEPEIIIRGRPNLLRIPPVGQTERELLVERPVELYQELIRRLTLKGEVVADFFVGSGSCPAAAASLERDYFGCELDAERRITAITKIKAYLPS